MSKKLGKMDMVVEKLRMISGIMWIDDAKSLLEPPRSPHGG